MSVKRLEGVPHKGAAGKRKRDLHKGEAEEADDEEDEDEEEEERLLPPPAVPRPRFKHSSSFHPYCPPSTPFQPPPQRLRKYNPPSLLLHP